MSRLCLRQAGGEPGWASPQLASSTRIRRNTAFPIKMPHNLETRLGGDPPLGWASGRRRSERSSCIAPTKLIRFWREAEERGMMAKNSATEGGDAAQQDGFYEAFVDDVVETYVGPPPDHCVFLVLRRTSGQRLAVKLSPRALGSLEKSLQAVRDHLAQRPGSN